MKHLISSLYQTGKNVSKVLESILEEQNANSRLQAAVLDGVLNGGKRIRPFLFIETAKLFGITDQKLFRIAAAIECVHCCSLIHDDLPCMDDGDFRRGEPTIHRRYDEATAVLAGDGLLTLAFEILADIRTLKDSGLRVKLVSLLSKASGLNGMIGGQMMDLEAENLTVPLDMKSIENLQNLKTGKLIQVTVEMGALIGNADDNSLKALQNYSQKIGLAFQIYDDLLDCLGTMAQTGKSVCKDEAKHKSTFVTLLGINESKSYAYKLVKEAKESLDIFGNKAKLLKLVADFIIDREC